MSRLSALWLLGGLTACVLAGANAQESGARAAADRDVAEERYGRLNSAVEDLTTAQFDLRRRIDQLAEALQRTSAEARSRPAEGTFVTRDEFNKLVKAVKDIDDKREADKRQILEEIENLGKSLRAAVQDTARRPAAPAESPRPAVRPDSKPAPKPDEAGPAANPAASQEGVWYVIESGNTLSAVVREHNIQFKAQGRRTSVKLVEEANPKLKPTSMPVGQKIWIPLVKIDNP